MDIRRSTHVVTLALTLLFLQVLLPADHVQAASQFKADWCATQGLQHTHESIVCDDCCTLTGIPASARIVDPHAKSPETHLPSAPTSAKGRQEYLHPDIRGSPASVRN